jgi:chromosome segregation ATPase
MIPASEWYEIKIADLEEKLREKEKELVKMKVENAELLVELYTTETKITTQFQSKIKELNQKNEDKQDRIYELQYQNYKCEKKYEATLRALEEEKRTLEKENREMDLEISRLETQLEDERIVFETKIEMLQMSNKNKEN